MKLSVDVYVLLNDIILAISSPVLFRLLSACYQVISERNAGGIPERWREKAGGVERDVGR